MLKIQAVIDILNYVIITALHKN